MNKKSVWMFVLTLVMVAYVAFAVPVTMRMARTDTLTGVEIVMSDPNNRFITAADIARECGLESDSALTAYRSNYDLYSLEQHLAQSDKIESANANILTNGRLRLEVRPMEPVARVFNGTESYYINRAGKKISAELRYHIDVPVLVGTFDSVHPAERLLPLLDHIATNEQASSMVATVTQQANGDIILVPRVVGHVINFGDTSLMTNKFRRLEEFYRQVMPTVGWMYYDTLSVKWRGQLVATRRDKTVTPPQLITIEEQSGILEHFDNETTQVPDSIARAGLQTP